MARFASFSSDDAVKRRLQAALFTNRKRRLARLRASGGGPTLATLPVTPTARWHPIFSTVTESGGRVVSASDLQGLADATEGGAGIGPVVMTDALGRKFWRFNRAEYLTVAAALSFANTRETAVFMVGRIPRPNSAERVLSAGSVALGTAGNGGNLLDARIASGSEPAFVGNARAAASGREHMVVGAQLQVIGALRRITANGGEAAFLNRKSCTIGTQSPGTLSVNGAEIGRYAFAPGASGAWTAMDVYEIVVYNTGLTVPQCEAISAALADAWGIVEIDSQLVMEGDSITQGTGLVTPALSAAALVADPGAGLIPANWRVVNSGLSGQAIGGLVTRRDAASGWPNFLLSGQNVMAFEIGRNSFGSVTAEDHYAAVVAYLNTTTTGVLQRGWTVRALANIATSASLQARTATYRALIRAPQFLTDTLTNTGQSFDGNLSIVSTDLIEDGGATIFEDSADALNTTYYAGDQTHPTVLGARLRVTGGDDPTKAITYGLS